MKILFVRCGTRFARAVLAHEQNFHTPIPCGLFGIEYFNSFAAELASLGQSSLTN